jgi:hypothetical protein
MGVLLGLTVVRYADLDLAALCAGLERQIIAWYALRTADTTGAGWVLRARAEYALHRLGWTEKTSALVLERGRELFWTLTDRALFLRSEGKIALALGITSFRAAFRAPLRDLCGGVASVRARLALQAVAALRAGRPVANATIAHMAGVNERTVQRWRQLARIQTHESYLRIAPLRPGTIAGDFRWLGNPALRTIRYRGRRWIGRRLPDSFKIPNVRGVRSRLRRGNRRLRAFSVDSGGDSARRRFLDAALIPANPSCLSLYHYHGTRAGRDVNLWPGPPDLSASGRCRNTGSKRVTFSEGDLGDLTVRAHDLIRPPPPADWSLWTKPESQQSSCH